MTTMSTRIRYAKGLAGKAKALVATAGPVIIAVKSAITDDEITGNEWSSIAVALVVAIGVYFVPNQGENVPPRAGGVIVDVDGGGA